MTCDLWVAVASDAACPHSWLQRDIDCYLYVREQYNWFDAQVLNIYLSLVLQSLRKY